MKRIITLFLVSFFIACSGSENENTLTFPPVNIKVEILGNTSNKIFYHYTNEDGKFKRDADSRYIFEKVYHNILESPIKPIVIELKNFTPTQNRFSFSAHKSIDGEPLKAKLYINNNLVDEDIDKTIDYKHYTGGTLTYIYTHLNYTFKNN